MRVVFCRHVYIIAIHPLRVSDASKTFKWQFHRSHRVQHRIHGWHLPLDADSASRDIACHRRQWPNCTSCTSFLDGSQVWHCMCALAGNGLLGQQSISQS